MWIKPLVTTWGFGMGMHAEFIWQGTMDYAPILSLTACVRTFNWMGVERVIERNHELTIWCGRMLQNVWHTTTLVGEDMIECMVAVRVPNPVARGDCGSDSCGLSDLHDALLERFKIEVPVFTFRGGKYVRVSVHVYNTKEDCYRLAKAVLEIQGYGQEFDGFRVLEEEMELFSITN
jgi:isopenicillin-N epimerase